jgi:uncharacterized NAD-dependent epimerase/dehydratase family protein
MSRLPLARESTVEKPSMTLQVAKPYLLFLGDASDPSSAKTAFGLRDWAPDSCIGEFALPRCLISTGLPRMTPAQARAAGARSLVIGVAPIGGRLDPSWIPTLVIALEAGLDLVSGMHTRLASVPELQQAAERMGRQLVDVRSPPTLLPVASGRKRTGMRLLTVGTDCALGKKYTALAIAKAFRARGIEADFRATGQTGILIAGGGIPIDAVVADFIAGAAETLSPDAPAKHWDVIEGQGSLFHPAYAGVTLGLLHGSQPDVLVVCHDPRRQTIAEYPGYPIPSLRETIDLSLRLARRVNAKARCAGISLNTGGLSEAAAIRAMEQAAEDTGLPAADPIRAGLGFDALVASCIAS